MFIPLGFREQNVKRYSRVRGKSTEALKLTSGDGTPANANMHPVRALSASCHPPFLQPLMSESTDMTLFDLSKI